MGDQAFVKRSRVRDYLLNPDHPDGRHKARMWERVFGVRRVHSEDLRVALQRMGTEGRVMNVRDAPSGRPATTWTTVCDYTGPNRHTGLVRAQWFIRVPGTAPSLTSAWPDEA